MDEEVAKRGWERNPFLWIPVEKRLSQARVSFLWSWVARDGTNKSAFEHPDLDKVIKRSIPAPRGMSESDTDLYMRLLAVADVETKASMAPCRYLGLEVGVDQYEPEPQNWDAADAQKTHVNVFYEFQHVSFRGSRYMVCCNAHDLLHHGRRLPMNPLRNTCPSRLTFSVEFFDAVGRNVRDIQFAGITFDGDKPGIVRQLPNEGVDVQKECVHWP